MADLNIRVNIRLSPGLFRWGLAAGLVSVLASELATESVTLTTYYPAPSGVYTQMITTNNTYLARDAGSVGIGTSAPNTRAALHVSYPVGFPKGFMPPQFTNAQEGACPGSPSAVGMVVFNTDLGRLRLCTSAGWADVGSGGGGFWDLGSAATGNANSIYPTSTAYKVGIGHNTPLAPLDVNGVIINRQADSACTPTLYPVSGFTLCPGGTYATLTSGIMARRTVTPAYFQDTPGFVQTGRGVMLCCTCPASPCPTF